MSTKPLTSGGLKVFSPGDRAQIGRIARDSHLQAHRVLFCDCDFLGSREPYALANTRSFMGGRKVSSPSDAKKMNRLYSVEADMTLQAALPTIARIDPSQIPAFSFLLAAEVLSARNRIKFLSIVSKIRQVRRKPSRLDRSLRRDLWPSPSSRSLWSNVSRRVQVAAFLINQNPGQSAIPFITPSYDSPEGIPELRKKIDRKEVDHLVILGEIQSSFLIPSLIGKLCELIAQKGSSNGLLHRRVIRIFDIHIGQSTIWRVGTWPHLGQKVTVPATPHCPALRYCLRPRVTPCSTGLINHRTNCQGFALEYGRAEPFEDFRAWAFTPRSQLFTLKQFSY